jgi:hypothetical protein
MCAESGTAAKEGGRESQRERDRASERESNKEGKWVEIVRRG